MKDGTLKPAERAYRAEMQSESEAAPDDEERRAWAVAMTLRADSQGLPLLRDAGPQAAPQTPEAWRRGDVSLTEALDEAVTTQIARGPLSGARSASGVVARLATSVDVGSLGKVSFSVDRSDAGVRVVMEVENEHAAQAVEAERLNLLRTLRAAGLTVLAFRVLIRDATGITLAQSSTKSNARSDSASDEIEKRDSESDRKHRRVRFVG